MSNYVFKFTKEVILFTFNFRKAKADKVTQLPGKEYTVSTENGVTYMKRKDEKFEWKPEPSEVEVPLAAIEIWLETLVNDNIRSYVDQGLTPQQTDINLAAILQDYVSGPADVKKFPKEMRSACAELFAVFLRAQGKKESGIIVQRDLLAGGVNVNTANKFIEGLPAIKTNLEAFILGAAPEVQETYAEYVTAMVEKIDNILNPSETINIADLGL